MQKREAINILTTLFSTQFNETALSIEALAATGSYRQYYRLKGKENTILGVYNEDVQENKAYLSFTNTFLKNDINVPKVYQTTLKNKAYLVDDLGPSELCKYAKNDIEQQGYLSSTSIVYYKKALSELHRIQTKTIQDLDTSYCYPRDVFDKQSMLWDLNYFKYMFLRVMRVGVDEQLLENDIQKLASHLDSAPQDFFLFRDFQSRNIIMNKEEAYLIDFQGGRKGAIYYDVASLLYDANVELKHEDREQLLDYYYNLEDRQESKQEFLTHFHQFAIIRLTQALGAFSLRGIIERKPHFKECIPYALHSLHDIFTENNIKGKYPCLAKAIDTAIESDFIRTAVES